MAKMLNPLLDLAMAFIPEDVIVDKTAHKLARLGWEWTRWGGFKTDIREAVKETRPPRGLGKLRLERVVLRLEEIRRLREKRSYRCQIDWSKWTPPSKDMRRAAVYRYRFGERQQVSDYRKVNGSRIYLRSWGYKSSVLYILRPAPVVGPRQLIRIKAGQGVTAVEAVFNAFGRALVFDALTKGRHVALDWDGLVTLIEQPNGEVLEAPWETY